MTGRTWLVVLSAPPTIRDHDWFADLQPVPDELALKDRIAIVSWPDRGTDRRAVLAATATVAKLDRERRVLRLRHRVSCVAGHEIPVASLGARLAAARGWSIDRRAEALGGPRSIRESDYALMEGALLEVAHGFGPEAKRPAHRRPRTPGRRALISARAGRRQIPFS